MFIAQELLDISLNSCLDESFQFADDKDMLDEDKESIEILYPTADKSS